VCSSDLFPSEARRSAASAGSGRRAQAAKQPMGGFWQPTRCKRSRGARIYSPQARRNRRQRHACFRVTRFGAQQLVSQDENARHCTERIAGSRKVASRRRGASYIAMSVETERISKLNSAPERPERKYILYWAQMNRRV